MAVPGLSTADFGNQCKNLIEKLTQYAADNAEERRTRLALFGPNGYFRTPALQQYRPLQNTIFGSDGIAYAELKYLRRKHTVLTAASLDLCDPPSAAPYYSDTVALDNLTQSAQGVKMAPLEWTRACESFEEAQMRRILSLVDATLVNAETAAMQQIIEGAGANATTAASIGVDGLRDMGEIIALNGTLSHDVYSKFYMDLLENEFEDTLPVIFHAYRSPWTAIERLRQYGCCNDAGIDQMSIAETAESAAAYLYKTRTIRTAFVNAVAAADSYQGINGDTDYDDLSVILYPGAAHLLEYHAAEYAPYRHGLSTFLPWVDPVSGEQFDMKITFTECDSEHNGMHSYAVSLVKQTQVYTMPTDQWNDSDALTGTNGIMLYKFSQATS